MEQFVDLSVSVEAPNNREDFLAKFRRHSRNASRRLSLQGLAIQTPLTRDHKIDTLHF